MKRVLSLLLILAAPALVLAQGVDTLQLRTIFHEPYLPGVRPTFAGFLPDGAGIRYMGNEDAMGPNEAYTVKFDGTGTAKAQPAPGMFGGPTASPDGKWTVQAQRGNLYLANADGSGRRLLFSAADNAGGPVWSSDSKRIAFTAAGDVWVIRLDSLLTQQVTRKAADAPGYQVRGWAHGNTKLIVTTSDNSSAREIFFPEYVGKFVEPAGSRRDWAHVTLSVIDLSDNRVSQLIEGQLLIRGLPVSASGRYLAVDQTDVWMKRREIGTYDLTDASYRTVFVDSTRGWIASGFNDLQFLTGTETLAFTSEQSGWNHLYTAKADGSGLIQHTKGEWEIDWLTWIDATTVLYATTEVDPGERHLYQHDTRTGRIRKLTGTAAFRSGFQLSPDKRHVVYSRTTGFNDPADLFALDLRRPDRETRLTNSVPERFRNASWIEPEYIRFTGRDGSTRLSMSVVNPPDREPGRKYPVVVFVHGAGSLQNVYRGWSQSYWREYLFHQFLAVNGYVVIEVDYRHSLGYGRKFREDVTGWMGKYELEDIIDGIDHVAARGYLDTGRVGVYGGSYGGFMALYAVQEAPDRFHAAAALRAVTNWENYYYANPGYTGPRLGHPDRDRVNYDRSSPLTKADSLQRPVLMLHGLIDNNVGFQDAMQYIEKLIQSGNTDFELMVYPSERHSFTDPDAWYDEYFRIERFFRQQLKP